MNMKDVCKAFNSKLEGIITDSFYDDDDGGFVELDIENPADIDMDIQIEIDSSYFGFSYCSYDETYSYDECSETVIDGICSKIQDILDNRLCLISVETAEKSVNLLKEISDVGNDRLAEIIAECTENAEHGSIKIILWNKTMEKQFSYTDNGYIFE
ncbi:MAG: hypothetical protein IJF18_06380 [Oscillospiraceae bacterium]|nr:hypothetical protein [Oscillospiraceae bacterium]